MERVGDDGHLASVSSYLETNFQAVARFHRS